MSTVALSKVYPKSVKGAFRRAKDGISLLLLTIYFVGPWLRWDRGPGATGQAILMDLEAPRGHVFGLEIWPQDIHYLAAALILGVLALFATASLAGRVWCGFACPQTVFTDLFVRIERLFEGERAARMRLDAQPWSVGKALRKAGKHVAWAALSLAFGMTFTFYFVEAPQAVAEFATLSAGPWMVTAALTLAATAYILAGWAREQMCNSMCPWPRIQSTMLDDHSLVVTYRADRGEGRGPRRKSQTAGQRFAAGLGDCIDCRQCVQVCPIGIDIRQGVSADCINCGLCIDACDSIMAGIGQPPKLIAFDSFANQAARTRQQPQPTRLLRPKAIAFAAVLVLGMAGLLATFVSRSSLEVAVLQERAPLFVTLADGSIRNSYTVKVSNKANQARALEIAVEGPDGLSMRLLETAEGAAGTTERVVVPADAVGDYRMFVAAPADIAADALRVVVREIDGEAAVSRPLTFFTPRAH
ncbi:cytochrome c oxidase accessory protein CcoG [Novispirillum sp. DQ9]|uniref:cytochrome c oxidase accessory protein CcoG n=1 Tax=Novispirillum sp. DQ9 TaxID=3398612 RepID=UPI003C79C65B